MISALLASSIVLNITTVTILILGEGNTILTIRVEAMSEQGSALGEEILRFAYAASVICPVVCSVVAAMVATERCCSTAAFNSTSTLLTPVKRSKGKRFLQVSPKQFDWVFDQEQDISGEYLKKNEQPKGVTSSSSSYDEATATVPVEHSSPIPKTRIRSTPTVEDLQNSLAQMSHNRSHPEDSLEISKSPPLAGEVVAIQVHRESGDPMYTFPVAHPLTRSSSVKDSGVSEVDAAPKRVRTLVMEDISSKLQRNKMSSFRAVERKDLEAEHFSPSKKNIRRSKSPTMESIIEVPTSECASSFVASPSVTSGYGSSPEGIENGSKDIPPIQTPENQTTVPVEMETPRKTSTGTVARELYGKKSLFRQERIFAPTEV